MNYFQSLVRVFEKEKGSEKTPLTFLIKAFFSLLLFVSLFFVFNSSVYAATLYVNADSSGAASNPTRSFDDPSYTANDSYKTFSAAYTAASAGDTIELSGGTDGKTYLGHTSSIAKANLIIKGSVITNHSATVTIDYPGSGIYTVGLNADGITVQNLTVSRNGGLSTETAVRIYKNNTILNNVTVKNSSGVGVYTESTAGNTLINNSIFDMSTISGSYALNVGAGITVTNSIFIGRSIITWSAVNFRASSGTSTFNNVAFNTAYSRNLILNTGVTANFYNCVFASPGMVGTYNFYYATDGGIINTYNCLVQGAATTPHIIEGGTGTGTWNSTNDIINGFPYFYQTKENIGYLLFSTDDRSNIDYFKTLADYAMSNYGISMTIYVHETNVLTSDNKQKLQTLYKSGHDIGVHTRHHTDLSQLNGLTITYTGANSDMAFVVSNSGTTLNITGTSDTHGPINLTNASYDTLGELCTSIEAWDNFTCAKVDINIADSVLSTSFKDISTALPISTATDIPFDDDTGPNNRLYKEEISNSISDLESALHEDSDCSSYQAKSFAFPFNLANTQVIAWIRNNTNFTSARSNYSTGTVLEKAWLGDIDLYNIYNPYSDDDLRGPDYNTLSAVEQQSRIEQSARVMASYASNGFVTGILNHNESDGLTVQEFEWLMDEIYLYLNAYNIKAESTANIANEIRTSGDWSDGGSGFWTRTFTGSDDLRLRYNSPLINAGASVGGRTTDILGNSLVGTPDIGAYEFQAGTTSSLAQYKSDGTSVIVSGGWTNETSVVLKFDMSSINISDSLTPYVEIQPNTTPFTDTMTNSGSATVYSGSPVAGLVTVTGLTDGTIYHWQASVNNAAATGSWTTKGGSPDFGVDTTLPSGGYITYSDGDNSSTSITLTVNDGTDASSGVNTSSRIVQRRMATLTNESCGSFGSFSTISTTGTYPNFTDTAVNTGFCYQYQYLVSDGAGNQTIYTSPNIVKTVYSTAGMNACEDVAPVGNSPWLYEADANNGGSITLRFTNWQSPVDHFALEYGTNSNNYQFAADDIGGSGIDSYTVNHLSPNTTYYFRVRSGNGCATGAWSNEISVKTLGFVSTNNLNITQSSIVPVETNQFSSCQTYTVKPWDTLWKISSILLGDGSRYKDIVSENSDSYPSLKTSNNVNIGWELKINCQGEDNKLRETTADAPIGGYKVNIKVKDVNGNPVENATVTLHSTPQTTKTDKDGVAIFTNVESGNHTVEIAYNNYQGEQSINLMGDVKEFNLNVTMQPQKLSFSPLAFVVAGIMVVIILILAVFLARARKRMKKI